MIQPICLITGVELVHVDEGWWKPADLFIFGDRFIVNASGGGNSFYLAGADRRALRFEASTPHFERRNVYIFEASLSLLNEAARDYIRSSPHAPSF